MLLLLKLGGLIFLEEFLLLQFSLAQSNLLMERNNFMKPLWLRM